VAQAAAGAAGGAGAPQPPVPLTEEQKFEQTLLGALQIPQPIIANLALNGYNTMADLAYFGHKDFEDYCHAKARQALNRGGANYSDKVIKRLQGLVWRASEMKRLNQPLLIDINLTRDETDEWYFEAVVEVAKLKKEFEITTPEKFVYAKWVMQRGPSC